SRGRASTCGRAGHASTAGIGFGSSGPGRASFPSAARPLDVSAEAGTVSCRARPAVSRMRARFGFIVGLLVVLQPRWLEVGSEFMMGILVARLDVYPSLGQATTRV